jgi:hypothetical protein
VCVFGARVKYLLVVGSGNTSVVNADVAKS